MVCCALLSLVFATLLWIFNPKSISNRGSNIDALSWRLTNSPPSSINGLEQTGFSLNARLKSFFYAFNGLYLMIRSEHNCWIHLTATIFVLFCAVALQISLADWRWIILAISLVWLTEAINTALEYLCDAISPNFNQAIGAAKDIAAGAVLISALVAVILGMMTFMPYIEALIQSLANDDGFICGALQ